MYRLYVREVGDLLGSGVSKQSGGRDYRTRRGRIFNDKGFLPDYGSGGLVYQ